MPFPPITATRPNLTDFPSEAVHIELDGPGKNALGTPLLRWLDQRLEAAGDRPLLITGAGDSFSAGLDLKEIVGLDVAAMTTFLRLLEGVVSRLALHPGPTVALVDGHAIAGGCILALACDRRIGVARPRARIGLNEVAIGLRFPPSILRLVQLRVPARTLDEVVLGAGLHAPTEALRLGLLDEVFDDLDAAQVRAIDWIKRLGALPAAGYAGAKTDLRGATAPRPDEAARFAAEVVPLWTSAEVRARIAAILGC